MIHTFIFSLSTLVAIVLLSLNIPEANACHRHRCRARHVCYRGYAACTPTTAPAAADASATNAPPPAPAPESASAAPAPAPAK